MVFFIIYGVSIFGFDNIYRSWNTSQEMMKMSNFLTTATFILLSFSLISPNFDGYLSVNRFLIDNQMILTYKNCGIDFELAFAN